MFIFPPPGLPPPPARARLLAGLVIGTHIEVGVSNVHGGSTWPAGESLLIAPEGLQGLCRMPYKHGLFFLKDGEDAAGAGTQGPSGADLLHAVQREAFVGDRGGQDPEHHRLPKDGLDLASRCPPAS